MKSMSDLMFNLVIIFCILFFLSFMQINIKKKKDDGIKPPAEVIISVKWPDKMYSDVDSWLEMINGDIVWFRDKDKNVCILDRDDKGMVNGTIRLSDGSVIEDITNIEYTTIRTKAEGTYVFNIHLYRFKNGETSVPVVATIMQVNPTVKILYTKKYVFTKEWEEITVCSINFDEDGVKTIDTEVGLVEMVKYKLQKESRDILNESGRMR